MNRVFALISLFLSDIACAVWLVCLRVTDGCLAPQASGNDLAALEFLLPGTAELEALSVPLLKEPSQASAQVGSFASRLGSVSKSACPHGIPMHSMHSMAVGLSNVWRHV